MSDDFIINLFSTPAFYSAIAFTFCLLCFSWFLGFSIKSVIDLLRNVKSVT